MRKGWQTKKFGEVCEIIGGSQPPKSNFISEPKDGYIRLIQVRDYKTDKYITYIPKDKARRFCTKTDLMIGRYGPPIFGIFRGLEGAYNVALMKAVPNEKIVSKEYFFQFLKNPDIVRFVEQSSKRAAGQDGVRKDKLYEYPIQLPPLPEQERIVSILDKAFEGIDKAIAQTEQNLASARELFESYLNNIFTQKGDDWVEKELGEVCENLDRKRIPITKSKREAGDIPYYGASGVVDYVKDYIFDEELLLVSEDGANLLARTYPIAFSIIGKTWINNHAHVLKFENKTSQLFVEHYLNSITLAPYVSGMAQPKLNQKALNGILIPVPPIETQKQIVRSLHSLEEQTKRLQALYTQKLNDLKELKQSLLQQAFAGELTKEDAA
ncbi:restriction endonuclease subunit S [Akkermansiaceae bacterium]|nr:restriction endonuclease subunit S [Akkermansiaceae bacterium]MDC0267475.1 restriction endonuclease subunit S [Akkermansiaceae bacterium]